MVTFSIQLSQHSNINGMLTRVHHNTTFGFLFKFSRLLANMLENVFTFFKMITCIIICYITLFPLNLRYIFKRCYF